MNGVYKNSKPEMSLKSKIKKIIPSFIYLPLKNIYHYRRKRHEANLIAAQPAIHHKAVEKIRAKQGPINVVFFALINSVWKYDILYQLMEKDNRFNPVILVCPVVNYGRKNMLLNMESCYNLFKQRGYNVIRSYDRLKNKYIDVRQELSPDVIFYTNPYDGLIDKRYYITNFLDILTCYSSYFFTMTNLNELTDTLLHNLVWKRYVENDYLMNQAIALNRNHGNNCINTGYPGFDSLINNNKAHTDPWKIKNHFVKRIIWAPHHTISATAQVFYSTFLDYYDFMFELAKKYHDFVQISFKPHPLLKDRLVTIWGNEKTSEYYERWANLENGMLNEGAYEDLFLTSDAMIHDSSSFIGEYLITGKPAIYLANNPSYRDRFNEIGIECLDNHYIARSKEEVENLLTKIIKGSDPLIEERRHFVKNKLLPRYGKLASENIINDLSTELIKT